MAYIQGLLQFNREQAPEGAKLRLDSRQVNPGDVFFAIKGRNVDGAVFMQAAADRGASCIIADGPAAQIAGTILVSEIAIKD